ncbi:MAG: hypothetical protein ACREDK_09040 [Thermoplasmata archaeon]
MRACDKPATGFVEAGDGRRIYTCDEHAASAKAKLAGRLIHGDGRTRWIGHPPQAMASPTTVGKVRA